MLILPFWDSPPLSAHVLLLWPLSLGLIQLFSVPFPTVQPYRWPLPEASGLIRAEPPSIRADRWGSDTRYCFRLGAIWQRWGSGTPLTNGS